MVLAWGGGPLTPALTPVLRPPSPLCWAMAPPRLRATIVAAAAAIANCLRISSCLCISSSSSKRFLIGRRPLANVRSLRLFQRMPRWHLDFRGLEERKKAPADDVDLRPLQPGVQLRRSFEQAVALHQLEPEHAAIE